MDKNVITFADHKLCAVTLWNTRKTNDCMEDKITFLQRINPRLYEKFCQIASQRQANVRLIMENVTKPGNLGAIARSCDGLGVQQIGYLATPLYEKHQQAMVSTSKGVSQWLTYAPFENTAHHLDELRGAGWRILATSSVKMGKPLDEIDFAAYPKLALVVGSELTGLSPAALEKADELITIPMQGFVESFNVSVAAALIVAAMVRQRQDATFLLDKIGQQQLVDQFVDAYFNKHKILSPWLDACNKDEEK